MASLGEELLWDVSAAMSQFKEFVPRSTAAAPQLSVGCDPDPPIAFGFLV